MHKTTLAILFLLGQLAPLTAQGPQITVEDVWAKFKFYPEGVDGFNFLKDGRHYTRLEKEGILQYDLLTGNQVKEILLLSRIEEGLQGNGLEDYAFNQDENKLLLKTASEKIYRHSDRASYYLYDRGSQTLQPLSDKGKQQYATFSPSSDKVAFCRGNNIFYKNLPDGKEIQVTKDGQNNQIINGSTDWVYEEEFGFTRAFEWSPDGRFLAFIRFDETQVPQFTMDYYRNGLYPEPYTFKYPKAGEQNSRVSVLIYDTRTGKTVRADLGTDFEYVPRIKWTQDPNQVCLFKLNRHQNHLQLLLADAQTGKTALLLEEKSNTYVDIHDHLTFLKDGKHFIWSSEKSGYNHLYLHQIDRPLEQQLTAGEWDVTAFYGVDETRKMLYFQSTEKSPLERQVYAIDLNGRNKRNLTREKGFHTAEFSSTHDYFVHTYSHAGTPPVITVRDLKGQPLRSLVDNQPLAKLLADYGVRTPEFFQFKTTESVQLNGWMIKPKDFDPQKKYPVFMYLYGGPGSQEVLDEYDGTMRMWFQMLAQKGYIVACVDNRGTGGRGEAFKKVTYLQLGKYETIDQIEAARWLGKQSYVDASRIGIFGWSFGGYMSTLCLLKGAAEFKMAIAVAPVTNWKWYDNIYTERFMRTPGENQIGYEDNSPVNFARNLKGKYLIVHGMADDNVHFQHTAEMMNALILAGKQFDSYVYPNSNHSIGGGVKRLHLFNKMTDFILENL
jgi:dipeptidyl-peptidase-4